MQKIKPHVATTHGYEDICEKPFRKISERTVQHIFIFLYWGDPQKSETNGCRLGLFGLQPSTLLFLFHDSLLYSKLKKKIVDTRFQGYPSIRGSDY